ncbi:unnamed protein product [Peronospora belbahrii]|uniref:Uncharacterized protein n=1 Tax=Peronospora belbahrii TaxID=622444 RepID=A0AAU9KLA1_9STRA|nr:unnamed protein product [Peronospora belbahrii]
MSNPEDTEEEFYVSKDGQISVSLVDDKSRLDKLKLLVQARERELRQAAEYGLGLLEANEELQMQVKTLKIQLETETEELVVERDAWKRRTEHAKHEIIQWKRKYARVEEEKTILAEEFEQFVDHCECRRQDIVPATDDVSVSSENEYSHHLDTIAQLQTELQKVQMLDHSKEMELKLLREWKQIAEQQQHETCECEVFAEESENLHKKKLLQELNATQRGINELKIENDALHKAAQQHETDMQLLKKQLRVAEEAKDDTLVHSNRVSEELLSSESRCQRLQRELELLQHISYFSQAIVDRDDEESDEDDESIEVKDIQRL